MTIYPWFQVNTRDYDTPCFFFISLYTFVDIIRGDVGKPKGTQQHLRYGTRPESLLTELISSFWYFPIRPEAMGITLFFMSHLNIPPSNWQCLATVERRRQLSTMTFICFTKGVIILECPNINAVWLSRAIVLMIWLRSYISPFHKDVIAYLCTPNADLAS